MGVAEGRQTGFWLPGERLVHSSYMCKTETYAAMIPIKRRAQARFFPNGKGKDAVETRTYDVVSTNATLQNDFDTVGGFKARIQQFKFFVVGTVVFFHKAFKGGRLDLTKLKQHKIKK